MMRRLTTNESREPFRGGFCPKNFLGHTEGLDKYRKDHSPGEVFLTKSAVHI
jgi:hypothetical protein